MLAAEVGEAHRYRAVDSGDRNSGGRKHGADFGWDGGRREQEEGGVGES